jgi:hypothetical protein
VDGQKGGINLTAYVPVPKDLTKIKTKIALNMTKRQIVCFGAAVLIGVPLFFLLKDRISASGAALVMVLVMLPFFLLAMYEKHGRPLEKIAHDIIQTRFIRPKERPYKTENFYAVLERQNTLDKEVKAIVTGNKAIVSKEKKKSSSTNTKG